MDNLYICPVCDKPIEAGSYISRNEAREIIHQECDPNFDKVDFDDKGRVQATEL